MSEFPTDGYGILLALVGLLISQVIQLVKQNQERKTGGGGDQISRGEWAAFKQEWGAHRQQSIEAAKLVDKISDAVKRLEEMHHDSDSKFSTVQVLKDLRELKEEIGEIKAKQEIFERKWRNGG